MGAGQQDSWMHRALRCSCPSQSLPHGRDLTWKKVMVEPAWMVPYSMLVWSAKSSADSMGTSIRCTVRKAARLAV